MSEAEATAETYALWLQAQCPPFQWFMELPRVAQDTFALQGTIHRIDGIIDEARAMRDPELFEAEFYADGDPEAEAVLVERLAAKTVAEILGPMDEAPPEPKGLTMAGAVARCENDEKARHKAIAGHRRLLGRAPDGAQEAV